MSESTKGEPQKTQECVKQKYRFLGSTGLKVSELCLGSMTLGAAAWGIPSEEDEQKCFELLDTYVESGGNFIDTANVYGYGSSEIMIGKWMYARRDTIRRSDLVIATKVGSDMDPSKPNQCGLSRAHIMDQVQQSLNRLGTHYIDLYQVHVFDAGTDMKETLTTLNDLVRRGLVRYIGASNFVGWQLQKTIDTAKHLNIEVYCSLQPQYSLLCRTGELELFPVCRNEGLAVLPWSPLKGGWLTGKYKREDGKPTDGTRVAWAQKVGFTETSWDAFDNEFTWDVLDEVRAIAEDLGVSMAQVSLRWVMQRPGVTCPIVGARTVEQLKDNLGALSFKLSKEQMARLDKVSFTSWPYPWGTVKSFNARSSRRRYARPDA
eukprot:TRINITY_DN479_c3_g1_i1.p1 TRINITY_DN479_c3_g1~~TRINITY_DN479_c3_g1_i1.p1  ORF type:complete len:376 (+),score=47.84 TRINITY_DN479_c3_g1_i1:51-1178(+)